jgi:hypothetical protein
MSVGKVIEKIGKPQEQNAPGRNNSNMTFDQIQFSFLEISCKSKK